MQTEENTTELNDKSVSAEKAETDSFVVQEQKDVLPNPLELLRKERERRKNLVRPKIGVWLAFANIFFPLAVASGIFCALFFTLPKHKLALSLGISLSVLLLYVVLRMRAILIWCVKAYQAIAPDEVRLRCVFTPSCSEYAIEALQKYGVVRGVPKIIKRLRRCQPPNGGKDELE